MLEPAPRFTIGRLMAGVAVAAGIFALIRTTNGTGPVGVMLMLPLASLPSLVPARYARPGRWLLVASWIAALWPLSIVGVINAAFGVAHFALGRSPVHSDRSQLLSGLESVILASFFAALAATLIGLYFPLIAPNRSNDEPRRWNPQAIPVLLIAPVWLLAYFIVAWDPAGVWYWLSD